MNFELKIFDRVLSTNSQLIETYYTNDYKHLIYKIISNDKPEMIICFNGEYLCTLQYSQFHKAYSIAEFDSPIPNINKDNLGDYLLKNYLKVYDRYIKWNKMI